MPLHHSAAIETLVLDDAPIEVRLAVLPPFGSSKEYNDVDSITKTIPWESGRSSLQAFLTILPVAHTFQIKYLRTKKIQKPAFPPANPRSRAPGFPDGSTVDADGCLWNAEWGGGRVVRYAPDGRVLRVLPLPASQVTCCAFGGARLDRLYVTTARTGLDPSSLAAEPHAGALFAFDVGVSGLADPPFDAKV